MKGVKHEYYRIQCLFISLLFKLDISIIYNCSASQLPVTEMKTCNGMTVYFKMDLLSN